VKKENYTAAILILHIKYTADSIIDVPTSHLKSDYSSEKLLQLKYSIKIIRNCLEIEYTTASKIPKLIHCSW
jgi:hypothetical protein